MSKRRDILDGTNWKNLVQPFGLIYTCKGGWIDLGHLNPHNPRIEIGAANLWKQVKSEGKAALDPRCTQSIRVRNFGEKDYVPPHCKDGPEVKFPDGSTGFKVWYRQDHGGYPFKPGREGYFVVKHGLSIERKKQVALAIFMKVTHRFEDFQLFAHPVVDSGYSQEDLVSNLIGFYIGIGEIKQSEALKLLHPVSQKTAFKIWDEQGAVGSTKNKNKNWYPKYAKAAWLDNGSQCIDECSLVDSEFPLTFQRIKPAVEGVWFKESFYFNK